MHKVNFRCNQKSKLPVFKKTIISAAISTILIGTASANGTFVNRIGSNNPFNGITGPMGTGTTLGDVDNDGDLDLLVGFFGNPRLLQYHENTGSASSPTFSSTPSTILTGLSSSSAKPSGSSDTGFIVPNFADLDNDGDLDLIFTDSSGSGTSPITYYRNDLIDGGTTNSAPSFSSFTPSGLPTTTGQSWGVVRSTDIDLDGDDDVIVVDGKPGNATLFLNNGSGSFSSSTFPDFKKSDGTTDATFEYPVYAFSDIDGDSDLDAIVGEFILDRSGCSTLCYFENNGTNFIERAVGETALEAFFNSPSSSDFPNDLEWPFVSIVDLDDDGDLDLVVGDYQSSGNETIRYLRNESVSVSSLSPVDDATGVSTSASFSITFTSAVTPQTGKSLTIKQVNDNSTVATLSSSDLSGGGTTTISFTPSGLSAGVAYYIQWDLGLFQDSSTADVIGISDLDFWNFTTLVGDITPPAFDSAPAASSVAATSFNIDFSLDEQGTVFAVAVPDGESQPSVAQVFAGQKNDGSAAASNSGASNSAVSGTSPFTSSVSLTGLSAGLTYDVYVVAQDDEDTPNQQATVTAVANVTTTTDTDSTISAGPGSEASALATIIDTVGEETQLFDFSLNDAGTSDGIATTVTALSIPVSGTSTDSERALVVWTLDGPDASSVAGSYDAGSDVINFASLSISVADNTSETYSISGYFNDNFSSADLVDGSTYILSIGDTGITEGPGSTFTTSSTNSGSGFATNVTATALSFTTEPDSTIASGSNFSMQPKVSAIDARGNVDVDYNQTVTLSGGDGTLTGILSVGTSGDGVADYSGIGYSSASDADANFAITATGSGLTAGTSNTINPDVVATKFIYDTEPAPTSISSGVPTAFTQVPVVHALDADNILDTGFTGDITLSIVDTGGTSLTGGHTVNSFSSTADPDGGGQTEVTQAASGGIATFDGLTLQYTVSGANDVFDIRATGSVTAVNSTAITAIINNAPAFAGLNGNPSHTEGGSAVVLDADVTISDVELDALNATAGNYSGATLAISRNGGANTNDVFAGSGLLSNLTQAGALTYNSLNVGTVTTNSGGTLLLTLSDGSNTPTTSIVNSIMQAITYSFAGDDPPASVTLDWVFNDGTSNSSGTNQTVVDITAVNDPPTDISVSSTTINESSTGTTTNIATLSATDADDTPTAFSLVTADTAGNGDCGTTSVNDADNADFAISGTDLQSATALSAGAYEICIQVSDEDAGGAETFEKTFTITIADDVAPVLAEVTAVPDPTTDSTPSVTFSSTEAGTIIVGGDCNSAATSAVVGNNTITLDSDGAGGALLDGNSPFNCTITVEDTDTNQSTPLSLTAFSVDTTAPTLDTGNSLPADNTTNVAVTDTILLSYDENVLLGNGETITLFNVSNNATLEIFTASSTTAATGSDGGNISVNAVEITITPGSNLPAGTNLAVQYGASSVTDTAGNTANAVSSNTAYDITTLPQLSIAVSPTTITETAVVATYTVTLEDDDGDPFPADGNVTMTTTIDGGSSATGGGVDYNLAGTTSGGSFQIDSGQSTNTFTVTSVDDGQTGESPETVIVNISGPGGNAFISSTSSATLTISENQLPDLAGSVPAADTINEDETTSIDLSAVTLTDGDDTSGTLTFAVDSGTVSSGVGNSGGVTVTGSGSASMELAGDFTDIVTYLDNANAVQVTSAKDSTAAITLTVTPNDGTSDGAAENMTITVTPVNDNPTLVSTFDAEFDFDNTTGTLSNTDTRYSQTVSGVTMTVDIDSGTWTNDNSGGGGSTDDSIYTGAAGPTSVTFGFDSSITVNSFYQFVVGAADGGTFTYAAGGSTTDATETGANIASGVTISPSDWTNVTGFTVTNNGGAFNPAFDTLSYSAALNLPTFLTFVEETQGNVDLSAFIFEDVDNATITVTLNVTGGTFGAPASGAGQTVTETQVSPTSITLQGSPANIGTYLDTASNITFTGDTDVQGTGAGSLTILANDGTSGDVTLTTLSLNITNVNETPIANDDTGVTTDEDVPLAIGVLDNDSDSDGTIDATTVAVASGPTNGSTSVNPTNGQITYTPDANFNGNDSFTYTVEDNEGSTSNAATVSVTINPVNDPPTAVSDSQTIVEDSGLNIINVLDNDVDIDSTINTGSLAIATQASNGTAALNGTTLRYQPNSNFTGSDTFTYTVADNEGAVSDPGSVTITVTALNDNPVARDDSDALPEGTSKDLIILANDSDVDGTIDPATVEIVTQPESGSVVVSDSGLATYTPNAGYTGLDSFTYTVKNTEGVTTNVATVNLAIDSTNVAPEVADDTATVDEDSAITISVLDNDTDTDGTLDVASLTIISQPASGDVTIDEDKVTYTPAENFNGFDEFSYRIADNDSATSIATVSMTITPVNDPPVANDPLTLASVGELYSFTYNPSDIDGDTLTLSSKTLPAWLTFAAETGLLSGTPSAENLGDNSVILSVTDGTESIDTEFILVVSEADGNGDNTAPEISGVPQTTVEEGSTYSFVPTATDADGDTLTFSIENQPSWAGFNTATGALTGTPTSADVGLTTGIVISVSDAEATSSLAAFSIEVLAPNAIPVANSPLTLTASVGAIYSFTYVATDADADDILTLSAPTLPDWLEFNDQTGELFGTPEQSDVGTHPVVLEVTDGEATVSTTFTLQVVDPNVDPNNNAPVPNRPETLTVNVGEVYSFTYSATDVDVEDTLTYSALVLPDWLDFNTQTGVLSGTPAESDIASHQVSLQVTDDTETVTTSFTIQVFPSVDPGNNAPTGQVQINGTAEQNQTLTVNTDSIADPDGLGDFSISWMRNGVITGATGTSYVLTQADVGSTISVVVSYVDGAGTTESLTSAATLTVTNVNDAPSGSVTISGDNVEGSILTLNAVLSDLDGLGNFLYQWQRNGKSIPGATGDTYTLSSEDVGKSIKVVLSYTDQQGTIESITSNQTEQIIPAESQNEPPTITPPEEVTVNATGLFTPVDLGVANAVDANGDPLPVSLSDSSSNRLPPGKHIVYWEAEDANGETATVSQIVNVNPIVSFSKDQSAVEGTTVSFRVILNGEAATYPVTVPYSVESAASTASSGSDHNLVSGVATIQSGTEATISFDVLTDDEFEQTETIVARLDSATNAVVSSSSKRQIVFSIVQGNVAPEIVLEVSQRGESRLTVAQDEGAVIVNAQVSDLNTNDVVSVEWTADGLVDTSSSDQTFVFDPASVTTGIYQVTLFAADDANPIATNISDVFIEVIDTFAVLSDVIDTDGDLIPDDQEGYADADGDGIPDYLDAINECNVMPYQAQTQDEFLVEADPGVCMRRGSISALNSSDGLEVLPVTDAAASSLEAQSGLKHLPFEYASALEQVTTDEYKFSSNLVDFRGTVSTFGQSMSVVLPQRVQIPQEAVYRKRIDGLWQNFVVDDNNALASAPGEKGICPPPGDEAFTEGLTEGHWCVQLTIEDGGVNDADGNINQSIDDTGGVATLVVAPEPKLTPIPLSQTEYEFGTGEQTVLAFLVTTQAAGAELRELVFRVSGDVDPMADIGIIGLYSDSNGDGIATDETLLAVGVPDVDTGQVTFTLETPLTLPAGETRLLVTYEF